MPSNDGLSPSSHTRHIMPTSGMGSQNWQFGIRQGGPHLPLSLGLPPSQTRHVKRSSSAHCKQSLIRQLGVVVPEVVPLVVPDVVSVVVPLVVPVVVPVVLGVVVSVVVPVVEGEVVSVVVPVVESVVVPVVVMVVVGGSMISSSSAAPELSASHKNIL